MKIRLKQITPDDKRTTTQLSQGEVVSHKVKLEVDGDLQTYTVHLKANVLPAIDASLIYGDDMIEEMFRFEPSGMNRLYRAVAKQRRGETVKLPMTLVDDEAQGDAIQPRLEHWAIEPQTI